VEWNDLAYLLEVARTGSLSRAARHLDVATSTVARRLDALERSLGLRLLDRRPDGVRLTAHGDHIRRLAGGVRTEVAAVERVAAALRQGEWPDPVRLTSTEMVVADVLAPALPNLWRGHPGLRVHLDSRGEVVSLANREADVAVRMSRPVGDSLVARKLPIIRLGLYAGESYLGGREPASLDLSRERLLLYDQSYGRIPEVDWMAKAGLGDAVFLRTGSTRALLSAAVAGAGVALLPEAFARRVPALREIPTPRPIPARTPWLVVHRDLRRSKPIRAVFDWVLATFEAVVGARGR
jgi:DNA-binding transcriptional LysR family regulator